MMNSSFCFNTNTDRDAMNFAPCAFCCSGNCSDIISTALAVLFFVIALLLSFRIRLAIYVVAAVVSIISVIALSVIAHLNITESK